MSIKKAFLLFMLGGSLAACDAMTSSRTPVTAGPWDVTLSQRAADEMDVFAGRPLHSAFAVSHSESWGTSWNYATPQIARERALANCRTYLQVGDADCVIYAEDGKRTAPEVVNIAPISQHYRELDLASASTFFPRNDVVYSSDGAAAFAKFGRIASNPESLASMARNGPLESALNNSSFVLSGTDQVIWLGAPEATIRTNTDSGILEEQYQNWRITASGLLCLNDGRWQSSGNPIGMKCIVLRDIKNGNVQVQWASTKSTRQGIVVKADARYSQVR